MQPRLPALVCVAVAFTCLGCSKAQSIHQSTSVMYKQEGESVTLDCHFTVSYSYYRLYWYQQSSSGEMAHIINLYSQNQNAREGRYSVVLQKADKAFKLTISALVRRDSAIYFCAVVRYGIRIGAGIPILRESIGRGDKLIFGKGTRVTVEPKIQPNTRPSVFVMKNGTKVACLVKDFYPKTININLNSLKKITEFDPAIVVTPSGKYSAVKLGQYEDSDSVTCSVQHNNEILNSTNPELKESHSEPTKPGNEEQTSESCHEPKVHAWKMNMMSLTLLGLRVVLAKSIAINVLLTAKLFFF